MLTIFGIKNCDTIKKTKKYFDNKGVEYRFHDYRVDGIDKPWLENALEKLDWEKVLNKRGTTYRQLSDEQKQKLNELDAQLAETQAELAKLPKPKGKKPHDRCPALYDPGMRVFPRHTPH